MMHERESMKAALLFSLVFLASSSFAQQKVRFGQEPRTPPRTPTHTQPRTLTQACGPEAVSFKVKLKQNPPNPAPPPPGKAQLVFIHDLGPASETLIMAYPTTKYGVDGSWAGAGHGNSWLATTIAPGEHHLCAALQSSFFDSNVQLVHFTAEAGKTYYFRTRLITSRSVELLEFDRIDSDQGEFLISNFPRSTSTRKK